MQTLCYLACLLMGVAMLPVSGGAESALFDRPAMDAVAFTECTGCTPNSLAFGVGAGIITVTGNLTVAPGKCSGTVGSCYVERNCRYGATTVTIANTSGGTLYWSHNNGWPRIRIDNGASIGPVAYPAGAIVCGGWEYFSFFITDDPDSPDANFIAAMWGWECSSCPG